MTAQYLTLVTKHGKTIIELFADKAPNHVARIKELSTEEFYNGLNFHRVINGFMAQTGCPQGNGVGGSDKPNLKAEFNDIDHIKGVVSMARAQDINSANSQFFIMLAHAPHLNREYTAFGQVIFGIEYIDMIKKGSSIDNGTVKAPDSIELLYVSTVDGQPLTAYDIGQKFI